MPPLSAGPRAAVLVLAAAALACDGPRKEAPSAPTSIGRPPSTDPTPPTTGTAPAVPVLAGLGPSSFTRAGRTGETFPTALAVSLARAVTADTFVAVATTSTALAIPGGGVTVPAGRRSAAVPVTGVASGVAILRASLDDASFLATIQVLDAADPPRIAALTPPSASLRPRGAQRLTVTLDLPARPGGQAIALSLDPTGAGSLDASARVAADALDASFVFTAGPAYSPATVTATLGGASATAAVPIRRAGLVLNEIDCAQPDTPDAEEFVELLNAGPDPVHLGSLVLVLIDGIRVPAGEVRRVSLAPAGTLAPGAYLVIAGARVTATVPSGVRVLPLAPAQDAIPDPVGGALLIDDGSGAILDRVSYGRAIRDAETHFTGGRLCRVDGLVEICSLVGGSVTVSLVEGTPLSPAVADPADAPGSLCRAPDGQDTDDAATDWRVCTTPTPGATNTP